MHLILSRKGFDSAFGGYPSPILPDGTLISLPIPRSNELTTYNDLALHSNYTYYDLMKSLRPIIKSSGKRIPLTPKSPCHLDPDFVKEVIPRLPKWRPLFGQVEAAQTHLENQSVSLGDIFLFFGWFRKTKNNDGKLKFESGNWKNGKHVIFGYMQIGEILRVGMETKVPDWIAYHPHCYEFRRKKPNNTIYVAREKISWDRKIPGAGVFRYSDELVLTKLGHSRSKWKLPDLFRNVEISFHSKQSWKSNYFQSAAIGQEFVVECNDEIKRWIKELILNNYVN